jgi:hypothetical protein
MADSVAAAAVSHDIRDVRPSATALIEARWRGSSNDSIAWVMAATSPGDTK